MIIDRLDTVDLDKPVSRLHLYMAPAPVILDKLPDDDILCQRVKADRRRCASQSAHNRRCWTPVEIISHMLVV